jgi:hypothetical protein
VEGRAQYDTPTDITLAMLRFQRASDGLNTGILAWHRLGKSSPYCFCLAKIMISTVDARKLIFLLQVELTPSFGVHGTSMLGKERKKNIHTLLKVNTQKHSD